MDRRITVLRDGENDCPYNNSKGNSRDKGPV